MEEFRNRAWKQMFRVHVLFLERFLLESSLLRLTGEQLVYLAGVFARRLDESYQRQIEDLLLEHPEQLDALIRQHAPYIGQNAPIAFISRINAEFLVVEHAFRDGAGWRSIELQIPVRYFDVAAFYARQSGNRSLADLFSFMRKNVAEVVQALAAYQQFLERHPSAEGKVPALLWERFGRERNLRNAKKERWERMGIDPKRKQHIHREEFHKMLDFTSPN